MPRSCDARESRIVFREAESYRELRELIRLRYRCFRGGRAAAVVPDNEVEMDLDCYDLSSRHFGLFDEESGQAIGYQRAVLADGTSPLHTAVMALASESRQLHDRVRDTPPDPPLPTVGLVPAPTADVIRRFYRDVRARGGILAECSRFCLIECMRSARIVCFAVEAAIASLLYALDFSDGLITVAQHQKAFYVSRGFRQIEGTTDRLLPVLQDVTTSLRIDQTMTRSSVRRRTDVYASEFIATGRITLPAEVSTHVQAA